MRQKILILLAGVALGMALLSGGYAAVNTALTATPSGQTFYIDGRQAAMTAYLIGGSNYVLLRDIGQAVGFNVYWDGAVQIESGQPYTGIAPADQTTPPAPGTPDPASLTGENVYATIMALRDIYPTNTLYPTPYRSTSNGPYSGGMNCAGWATLCSDTVFGNLPWRRVERPAWEQIRPGDLVRYDTETSGHVVVVLAKNDEYISVTESGLTNKVRWGGQYFKWWLEGQPGYTLYTRYPQ